MTCVPMNTASPRIRIARPIIPSARCVVREDHTSLDLRNRRRTYAAGLKTPREILPGRIDETRRGFDAVHALRRPARERAGVAGENRAHDRAVRRRRHTGHDRAADRRQTAAEARAELY